MTPELAAKFPSLAVTLKNNVRAHVRPLRADDGDALAEMYSAITWGEFRFFCPYPLGRATALKHASEANDAERITVVAEGDDKRIGGYAWVQRVPATAPQGTFGICVRGQYQGIGTGAALMARLFEITKGAGMSKIDLTVQLGNPRAVALYKKMGFQVVREQMRGSSPAYGLVAEPEYYMERTLA